MAWWCGSTMSPSCMASISTAPWRCCSTPRARRRTGQFKVNDKDVNWRVRKTDAGLLLNLVAARPCGGTGSGKPVDDRWRLEIHLLSNKRGSSRPACTRAPKTGCALTQLKVAGVKRGFSACLYQGPRNCVVPGLLQGACQSLQLSGAYKKMTKRKAPDYGAFFSGRSL
jgi:hypothetical protein